MKVTPSHHTINTPHALSNSLNHGHSTPSLAPPPPAPHGPRLPASIVQRSRTPSPDRYSIQQRQQEALHGMGTLRLNDDTSSTLTSDEVEAPVQPSAKALGKRRAIPPEDTDCKPFLLALLPELISPLISYIFLGPSSGLRSRRHVLRAPERVAPVRRPQRGLGGRHRAAPVVPSRTLRVRRGRRAHEGAHEGRRACAAVAHRRGTLARYPPHPLTPTLASSVTVITYRRVRSGRRDLIVLVCTVHVCRVGCLPVLSLTRDPHHPRSTITHLFLYIFLLPRHSIVRS